MECNGRRDTWVPPYSHYFYRVGLCALPGVRRKAGSGGAEPHPYGWLANFCGRADVGTGPYGRFHDK